MQQNECQDDTISKELKYLSALNLIMAMFRLAAQDLKYGNKDMKRDAKKFLRSAWFKELCSVINLDASHVRNVIIESDKVSIRGSYE